ncbi:hypothetical protein [Neolewinella antarctica]|uniref:CopG family transcriptional regulator n=1 Tax=Neolewinella antarctica TaxID=442734 RepID=A0ABX0XDN5_9BACT|nr:hypothetical protein [Neolewinella antarctica]NJC27361.1 hypothetical protein [Neolewinella antarctica]
MAKKRFKQDLSDLFENPYPGAELDYGVDAGATESGEESVEVEVPVKTSQAKRKLSSKKFTANLDAFLSQDSKRASGNSTAPSKKNSAPATAPRRRRKTGLDLLIRSTISKEEMAERNEPRAPDTKRVTLVFNKEHLVTLKEQAKGRKMYLKDVVQEMVANYLTDQE